MERSRPLALLRPVVDAMESAFRPVRRLPLPLRRLSDAGRSSPLGALGRPGSGPRRKDQAQLVVLIV